MDNLRLATVRPEVNPSTLKRLQFPVSGVSTLCHEVRSLGFISFEQLADHIRLLPYERIENSKDVCAVLREGRGTCSSKHQLLASVAQDCGRLDIQLAIGIYEMCEENTPGVDAVLRAASVTSIPEAHCYLSIEGERLDFTGLAPGSLSPFTALIAESMVSPSNLLDTKRRLHRNALAAWASAHGTTAEFAWATREACIAALSAAAHVER
jgi:hypothetical protein